MVAIMNPSPDPTAMESELLAAVKQEAQARELLGTIQPLYLDALHMMNARWPYWHQRMAFYRGDQWSAGGARDFLEEVLADPDEERKVKNYVRPTVRSAVADRLRNIPNPEAAAANDGTRSIARAQLAQSLCRSWLRNGVIDFEEVYRMTTAAHIHGAAWLKVYWDPNRGEFIDDTPMMAEDGQAPHQGPHREGEIAVDFVDVIDCMPDPHAKRYRDARHVFHRQLVPRSTLDDRHPVDFFGKPTEGRWQTYTRDRGARERDIVEDDGLSGFGGLGGMGGFGSGSASSELNELCEKIEYWEKPTNRYPGGRLIVFSGDVIVAAGPLPYDMPWVYFFGENLVPSGLYPDGVVEDILPSQRDINCASSKMKEIADKVINPMLLVPNESDINVEHISDIPGAIIKYNRLGGKPEWVQTPQIPESLFNMQQSEVATIRDISAYSEIMRGDAPPGVETGVAMAYLHEFSQGVHEPDITMFRLQMGEVYKKCLKLARQYYQEGRLVRMIGPNKRWTLHPFTARDYDLDTDIVVEAFTAHANSKALRLAMVRENLQTGMYGPPADPASAKVAQRMAEIDTDDKSTLDKDSVNRYRALAEHEAMLDNPMTMLQVKPYENDSIHLEEHDLFRNSDEFDALPPQTQVMFNAHCAQHEQNYNLKIGAYGQQAGALQGASPSQGMGGGPPPTGGPPGLNSQNSGPPPEANAGIESQMNGGQSALPTPPSPTAPPNQP